MTNQEKSVDHYGSQYGHFAEQLCADIRKAIFGEDIGQNGWLTAEEQDLFLSWLDLMPPAHLLDIACGSGGPTLRIAEKIGCRVTGIDVHEKAVATAQKMAETRGLGGKAVFSQMDASAALPFEDEAFDAIMCIDAINHLPDRPQVLAEWARLLKPNGRLLFTDPIVVTGPLTHEEIAIRASIGFFLFVPSGTDENLIADADLALLKQADRTENMAQMAQRWRRKRDTREKELRKIEGDHDFEGQQLFFEVAARLASERRLSRFAFLAQKSPKEAA